MPVAIGHGAGVRFFAGVKSLVCFEMRLLLEGLVADVAHEPSDVVVDEHVLRQESLRAENLVTHVASDVTAGGRRFPALRLLQFPRVSLLRRSRR